MYVFANGMCSVGFSTKVFNILTLQIKAKMNNCKNCHFRKKNDFEID